MIARAAIASGALLLLGFPAASLTLTEGTVWSERTIPVCWEDSQSHHIQERRLARKAIQASWERESALAFTGWGRCRATSSGIRLKIGPERPHTKARGRLVDGMKNGVVLPELWTLAAMSINVKAPVHEMGHALGFGHEFARPGEEVPAACQVIRTAFGRYIEDDIPLTTYDPDSIMVGCAGTAQRDLSIGVPLLSAADIYGLISVYGSASGNILDPDEPGDRFGAAIALGDLDGDGVVDLAVSAPGEDQGTGAVYIFRGDRFQGFRPLLKIATEAGIRPERQWGSSIGIQHVKATDEPVIVLGAADGRIGRVRLKLEPPTSYSLKLDAVGSNAVINSDRVLFQDLDGDGIPERIVGDPDAGPEATGAGIVTIERGKPGGKFTFWYSFDQSH